MPESDRYWKGELVVATLFFSGALIYVLTSLAPSVLGDWPSLTWPPRNLNLKPLFDAAPFLIGGLGLFGEGQRARRREALRERAIAGDVAAMPLARVTVAPTSSSASPPLPIELTLHGEGSVSCRRGCLFTLGIMLTLCLAVAMPLVLALAPLPIPARSRLWFILGSVVTTAVAAVLAIRLIGRRAQRYRTGTVVATSDGLSLTHGGPHAVIRWSDARLLEVTQHHVRGSSRRAYTLCSSSARITWFDEPTTRSPRADTPPSMFVPGAGDQMALLQLVAARTGLVPRTLAPELMKEPPAVQTGRAGRSWTGIGCLALLTVLLVATATLVLILPLTDYAAINLYVASTFALAGAIVLGIAIGPLVHRRTPASPRAPDDPTALPHAPTGEVGFIYRQPLLPWLRSLLGGVWLSCNIAGVIAAAGKLVRDDGNANLLRGYVAGAVAIVVLVGIAQIVSVLRRRSFTLLAGDDALTLRFSATTVTVPWADVASVTVKPTRRGITYTVSPGDEARAVEWSTRWGRSLHPLPGVQAATATELAAIACQRSGASLRVEEA